MRIILSKPFTLFKIKSALSILPSENDKKIIIGAVTTDSRLCEKNDLFIAIEGERQSGEDFIKEAKDKGAYTVSSRSKDADVTVKDTLDALMDIAGAYKSEFSLRETAVITGSVGKTTTKNLSKALLSKKFKVHATNGNFNNFLGVPYTILSMSEDTEILVVEAGMNHAGELKRLSRCIEPTVAIITNIGTAHIGNLGSRENIAKAKMEIIDCDRKIFTFIPQSEPLLDEIENRATVSTSDESADFFLKTTSEEAKSLGFTYFSPSNTFECEKVYSGGLYVKECLAFAIALALYVGLSDGEIVSAIKDNLPSLGNKNELIGSITVIDDSYNASPESVRLSLKSLSLSAKTEYSALLGDMLELGDYSEKFHYEIGQYAAKCGLKRLYLIGKSARHIMLGAIDGGMNAENIFYNADCENAEGTAENIFNLSKGETMLFKASRKMRLERIKAALKEYFEKE